MRRKVASESCVRVTNGVEVSNVEVFGEGFRTYYETTHHWTND
ncbi:MAG TPA: hypothetical protein VM925_01775 [Labilithrix sp.]|nr:hypothetical protein [Labilithrix sp.]